MTDRPTPNREPRLVRVTRRQLIHRSAVAATALALAPAALTACGTSDAEALATGATVEAADSATVTSETVTSETVTSETATSETSTPASTSTETSAETTTTETAAPAASSLEVTFTYEAEGSRIKRPYIAVWVEDTEGNLVDTISVWYQSGKGEKWIDDLRRWYSATDQASDVTMSGATRAPGTYTVGWDGTDLDGNTVADGDYVLYIEAAREHGPYSITSAPLTIGDGAAGLTLPDDGEILSATAVFV